MQPLKLVKQLTICHQMLYTYNLQYDAPNTQYYTNIPVLMQSPPILIFLQIIMGISLQWQKVNGLNTIHLTLFILDYQHNEQIKQLKN